MTREETKKLITVMQHYVAGGEVEFAHKDICKWTDNNEPNWNFQDFDYRIKKVIPEIGKWYEVPCVGKITCIASKFDHYIFAFINDGFVAARAWTVDHDFSNFKEVEQ